MKKYFAIIALILIAFSAGGKQIETKAHPLHIGYFEKSKHQRNTGLMLLGGGAACFVAGSFALDHARNKNATGVLILLGGMGLTVTSLSFFISSARNNHKAKVFLKREAYLITPNRSSNITYNSISLRLDL